MEPSPPPAANTPWKLAVAVLTLIIVALLIITARRHGFGLVESVDAPGMLREIRLMKELVTIRYSIQKVAGLREQKQPFGSESILLIVQAKVLAGIDLGQVSETNIRIKDRKSVAVFLPAPEILHVYLDENNTRVWDRGKTWWTPWLPYDLDLEKKARLAALDAVKQEAVDMGILKDAQTSAEAMIRAFLRPLGFETVDFPRPRT